MKTEIRRLSLEDIQNDKYIDKEDNQPAICAIQVGRVTVPLSENHFANLIESINKFTSIQVPCNECKYSRLDDKNISLISCSLRALMGGVPDHKLNKYNKNYTVNPMATCQYGTKIDAHDPYIDSIMEQSKSSNQHYNYTKEEIEKSKKVVPNNLRRIPKR